jgi:hypothetical protein
MPHTEIRLHGPKCLRFRGTACFLVAVLLGAASSGPTAFAHKPEDDSGVVRFLNEYRARLPVLIERYSTNRKIRYRYTHYVFDLRFVSKAQPNLGIGDVDTTCVKEVITDGWQLKSVVLNGNPADVKDTHSFWRPDRRFDIKRRPGVSVLANEMASYGKMYDHEKARYDFFAHEPMRAGGNVVGTTLWLDDIDPRGGVIAVCDVRQSTWKGKDCIQVRSRWESSSKLVVNSNTYLDPLNDHVVLGAETDWMVDSDMSQDPPLERHYKLVDEIEYRLSEEGFPMPKSSKLASHYQDGSKRKIYEVEFITYERYSPSKEEFQLEGTYGLTTPPVRSPVEAVGERSTPERASLPTRSARRWVILAAVAVLMLSVVLLILYTSRRPAQPVQRGA